MQRAEFDKFANQYLILHANNIRVVGEGPEYFARYKVEEIRRLWTKRAFPEPSAIMDFGSGIGASLPHLAAAFPSASLTAFDISAQSLAVAKRRFPNIAIFVHDENLASFPKASFDLIFTACVFHHIDHMLHVQTFKQLYSLLRPSGILVVFEHNPINPVTRYIVATCPFDENAVLIPSRLLRSRQRDAGFCHIETRFTGFFPHALAGLRWFEPHLSALPLGAQYYTVAHA